MSVAVRVQPEQNSKVLTLQVKVLKYQPVLESDDKEYEWKSHGKADVSILKSQKGRYSFEARQEITRRLLSNHSLSKDIKLEVHSTDEKKTWMWKTKNDIASYQDENQDSNVVKESLILVKFATEKDAKKFQTTWLDCQSKMK